MFQDWNMTSLSFCTFELIPERLSLNTFGLVVGNVTDRPGSLEPWKTAAYFAI
jgi:hypothetical protein